MSDKNKDDKSNIHISISDGMPIEKALRKFKRMCDNYGIVKEYRKRESYCKPSVKLKEKLEAAEKRRKKAITKNTRFGKKI
ncbi:MAG: 30S ribosomal protein S21 [Bacteriovoracaceae bacterium]|nr:30S ribosomal protein S21 [Bacteriovoracaceae bacterium]